MLAHCWAKRRVTRRTQYSEILISKGEYKIEQYQNEKTFLLKLTNLLQLKYTFET